MNDTNKERAEFEAHWYDLYHCGSISPDADGRYINPSVQRAWEAWKARAAKAPAAEPFAYCQPDDPLSSTAFVWPGIKRDPRHTMPLYTAPPAPTEQQIGALQAELAGNEAATMHLSRMVDELRALLCQAMRVMKDLHESATPDESREDCPPIIPTSDFAKFVNDNAALMYAIKQCGHDAAPPQGAANKDES